MSAPAGTGSARFEEGAPIDNPEVAAAKERAALDAALRSESDAGAADRGRSGPMGGGSGPAQGTGAGGAFDRAGAEKRIGETPPEQMTREGGACIFDAQELELLKLDMIGLKGKSTKPKERDATAKKFGAVDVIDLQKKKDTLSDRASSWRKRALEKAEADFKAGRVAVQALSLEERKRRWLARIKGDRLYRLWNSAADKARTALGDDTPEGMASVVMKWEPAEIKDLVPLSDEAIDENGDLLFEFLGIISPTALFCGAFLTAVGTKSFVAWQVFKHFKEQGANPTPGPKPSKN